MDAYENAVNDSVVPSAWRKATKTARQPTRIAEGVLRTSLGAFASNARFPLAVFALCTVRFAAALRSERFTDGTVITSTPAAGRRTNERRLHSRGRWTRQTFPLVSYCVGVSAAAIVGFSSIVHGTCNACLAPSSCTKSRYPPGACRRVMGIPSHLRLSQSPRQKIARVRRVKIIVSIPRFTATSEQPVHTASHSEHSAWIAPS